MSTITTPQEQHDASLAELRIGILGCAAIAKKNVVAIMSNPQFSACRVTAVASRRNTKARAFCNEMFGPSSGVTCFDNYQDLIHAPKNLVDALYIPLPTMLHKQWVLLALQAGKHVLLEKPVALRAADYQEMLHAARQQGNVYLMDGTMFVHHPRTAHFCQAVQNIDSLGTVTRIEAGFSFCGDEEFFQSNIRASSQGDPLGCLGDLGWYVLRMALLIVGTKARVLTAQVVDYHLTTDGVPVDATCVVKFQPANDESTTPIVLNFQCSFTSQFRQYVNVVGTKAGAWMHDFVLPRQHPVHYTIESMQLTQYDLITQHSVQKQDFDGPVQEACMWRNFARYARAIAMHGWDNTGNDLLPDCQEAIALSQVSTRNQQILDALMESIRGNGCKVDVE